MRLLKRWLVRPTSFRGFATQKIRPNCSASSFWYGYMACVSKTSASYRLYPWRSWKLLNTTLQPSSQVQKGCLYGLHHSRPTIWRSCTWAASSSQSTKTKNHQCISATNPASNGQAEEKQNSTIQYGNIQTSFSPRLCIFHLCLWDDW